MERLRLLPICRNRVWSAILCDHRCFLGHLRKSLLVREGVTGNISLLTMIFLLQYLKLEYVKIENMFHQHSLCHARLASDFENYGSKYSVLYASNHRLLYACYGFNCHVKKCPKLVKDF